MLWCPLRFPHKNDVRFFFDSGCLCEGPCLCCLCLFAHGGVQRILCCVFRRLMCPVLQVSLKCSFLIAFSVFSNVYIYSTRLSSYHNYSSYSHRNNYFTGLGEREIIVAFITTRKEIAINMAPFTSCPKRQLCL